MYDLILNLNSHPIIDEWQGSVLKESDTQQVLSLESRDEFRENQRLIKP